MAKNVMHIDCGKHTYKVVPVEGEDGIYTVTKDGVTTKRITHDELFVGEDIIDIEEWFNMA